MFKYRSFGAFLMLALFLAACGPATITPPDAQPLPSPSGPQPSPAGAWDITLSQSGGIAGVQLNVEVSSDGRLTAEDQRSGKKVTKELDAATLEQLSRLVSAITTSTPGSPHSNCADCFLYDLQITSGSQRAHVQADDTTLAASGAQALIGLLQQLRSGALQSQP